MINDKGRRLSLFTYSLVLSLLFFNLFFNVQISEAKSVSSVTFTAGQSAALTYGTAATVTFKVTVNITGSGPGPSVNLSTSPAITGVTYAWYNSSNTSPVSWPKKVSNTTTYTLRVTTTAKTWATAGTTITVTDRGSGLSGSGTLTINRAALTITAVTNTKTYDGTTSATAIPGVTGLKSSDTVTAIAESYGDKTAGTNKTINVTAYTVNDGNNGNNYNVTTVSNTAGVINKKALTVTGITANDKVYDGNTSATLNVSGAALIGVISGDNVQLVTASAVGTYIDSSVGTNKTVYVSGLTLSGADAGNYSLTQPTTTASIMGPHIDATPASPFDFGSVNVASSSSPQTFTISNTGNAGLVIGAVNSSNATEFTLSNDNCSGQTIAASGSCTLQVTFRPSTLGSRGATLTIPSNDPDTSSFLITLSGTGTAANIVVTPASPIDFGSTNVGSSSSPRTLTISNTGNTGLVIGAVNSSNAAEFPLSNDSCSGQTIAASGSCTLQVTFTPSTFGSRGATLTIPSNDPNLPNLFVTLDGTGTAANMVVSPASPVDFGSVSVGLSSSPQTFTVTNTGNTGLVVGTVESSNATEFALSSDHCSGQTIAASGSCTLQVTFTPSTFGSRGASLTMPSNDPDTPSFLITLSGIGTEANIMVSPISPVDFGSVNVGSSSSPQTFTVTNTGNTGLVMGTVSSDSADFVITNDNCSGQTVAASGNCTLQVTFTPSTFGPRGATLTIPSNDPDMPDFWVTLSGMGTASNIVVSPASPFDFGSVDVGSSSSPQTFTVSNTGNTGLVIGTIGFDITPNVFAITNDNCSGQTIASSGSCTLQVTFMPSTSGPADSVFLTIPSNDPDTPTALVALNGTGETGNIVVSPASPVNFGSINIGSSSAPCTLTISNTGNTGLVIGKISSGNTDFVMTNDNCSGQTVAAPGSCTLQVTFTPSTFGPRGATLTIPSNDPNTPNFLVTLDGTGVASNIEVSPASPVDFGSVNIGSSSAPHILTISNIGNTGLVIGTISSNNTDFAISSDNCSGQTIAASGSCMLQVTFTPSTSGLEGATLTIPSNDPDTPISSITLSGSAIQLKYDLNVNITGKGKVESTPVGISCLSGNGCSAQFNALSKVTLTATNLDTCPSSITWSGACIGNGSACDVTMTGNPTTENVSFTVLMAQVKNMRTGALYNTIQDAYDDNATISGDVLRARNAVYDGPVFDLPKDIEVQGGYGCNLIDPAIGFTTLNGPVVISSGSVKVGGFIIN